MNNQIVNLRRLGLVSLFLLLPGKLYAYDDIAVKDGATIRGAVKFEGKLPVISRRCGWSSTRKSVKTCPTKVCVSARDKDFASP